MKKSFLKVGMMLLMASMMMVSCGDIFGTEDDPSTPSTPNEEEKADNISFADSKVKELCVSKWDTNKDGEISKEEAAAVKSLDLLFYEEEEFTKGREGIKSFDELQYFTGITALEEEEFAYCKDLSSITLPNTITTIGGNAFHNCASLKAIKLPSSLKNLEPGVFVGCTGLTTINIPAQVETIEYGQFVGCSKLASITVDASNKNYQSIDGVLYSTGNNQTLVAYPDAKKGTSFTVADGTRSILDYSCAYSTFTELTLPESVDLGLGVYAFGFNTALKTINSYITDGIDGGLRDEVFAEEVYKSATLYVPAGWKAKYQATIGWKNFENIVEMGGAEEPSTDIISFADSKVKALCVSKWDTNGDGEISKEEAAAVKSLGLFFNEEEEFTKGTEGIKSFDELQYFTGITALEEEEFAYCKDLASITLPNTIMTIGGNAFHNCASLTTITLPSSVKTLEPGVFVGCTELTTINIPAQVEEIEYGQFVGCSKLASITVDASNKNYQSIDGVLYSIENNQTLVAYPDAKKGTSFTVADGTRSILDYSCAYSTFTELTLPESVDLGLGVYAFGFNTALKTINSYIKDGIDGGFRDNEEDFVFAKEVLQNATLYVPAGWKEKYQATDGWKNFANIVERKE